MKKLIKSGVCGTHEQCIYALLRLKKKEKEKENADAAHLSAIQTYTISSSMYKFVM